MAVGKNFNGSIDIYRPVKFKNNFKVNVNFKKKNNWEFCQHNDKYYLIAFDFLVGKKQTKKTTKQEV